jgi:hypothetical protein
MTLLEVVIDLFPSYFFLHFAPSKIVVKNRKIWALAIWPLFLGLFIIIKYFLYIIKGIKVGFWPANFFNLKKGPKMPQNSLFFVVFHNFLPFFANSFWPFWVFKTGHLPTFLARKTGFCKFSSMPKI